MESVDAKNAFKRFPSENIAGKVRMTAILFARPGILFSRTNAGSIGRPALRTRVNAAGAASFGSPFF